MLTAVGFITHHNKSILEPTRSIEILGFTIDSKSVKVKINFEKSAHIIKKNRDFLNDPRSAFRDLASVIGSLVSLFPARSFGKLYYRHLEKDKKRLLKRKKASNSNIEALQELKWCI